MTLEQLSLSPNESDLLKKCGPISFDLDGVLVYSAKRSLEVFNTRYGDRLVGKQYSLEDITHSRKMDEWFIQCAESEQERIELIKNHWNSEEVIGKAEPLNGSVDLISGLNSLGLRPLFVTSRPFITRQITLDWFGRYIPNIDPLQIFIQSGPDFSSDYKVETIRNYGVKIHFEDDLTHAERIVGETESLVVLVNHPWNRIYKKHLKIIKPDLSSEGDLLHSFRALINYLQAGSYNSG